MKRNLLCLLGVAVLTVFATVVTGSYRNDAVAASVVIPPHVPVTQSEPMVPVPRANTYVYRPAH